MARAYGDFMTYYNMLELYKGCDILVATPGRLLQFAKENKVYSFVQFLHL